MRKEQIIEILEESNFWKREQETGILRAGYLKQLRELEKTDMIVCIKGVRRSGKSTILMQYIKSLIERGIDPKQTLYVNFDDFRFFSELELELISDTVQAYLEVINPKGIYYLFFDEMQRIKGWEYFVRSTYDRKKAKIFITGSSSKLMSKEFSTLLTGRHLDISIFPLSFQEFLSFKDVVVNKEDLLDLISKKREIKVLLRDYLEYGGFPKVVLTEEKKEILKTYFDDIVTKDILERYRIRKANKLKALALYYATNISSLVSLNRIRKFLKISLDTVERFSSYLEEAYLSFFVRKFSYSLKEQEVNPRKVYWIDSGLRNALGFRFSQDIGKLYENLVFLELIRRGKEVYYWKNKEECDFLIKEEKIKEVIQVCYSIENEEVRKRELNGLIEAMKKFNLRTGLVITEDYEAEEKFGIRRIKFVPLWKWLLVN